MLWIMKLLHRVNPLSIGAPYRVLFLIYCAAHIPLLGLAQSRFWDDWSLFLNTKNVIFNTFQQQGSPLFGYFHVAILYIGWPAYAITTFLCYMAVTMLTYEIFRRLYRDGSLALLIAALVAVIPTNFARVSAATTPYAASLLLFMTAWWMLQRYSNRFIARITIVFLFMCSFNTGSLLVLYGAPIFYYIMDDTHVARSRRLATSLDLFLLPFIFWFAKALWFHPYGMFQGYNAPSLRVAISTNLLWPVVSFLRGDGLVIGASGVVAVAIFAIFLASFLQLQPIKMPELNTSDWVRLLATGALLTLLGIFPYIAVGKMPDYSEWTETRHQTAAILGLAVLLAGIIGSAGRLAKFGDRSRRFVLYFVFTLLVVNWWTVYGEFFVDYKHQVALERLMKLHPEMCCGNFVIVDNTEMSAFHTGSGLSELTALHALAGFPHGSILYDYGDLGQYSRWTNFNHFASRFFGRWSITEGIDASAAPSLYIFSVKPAAKNIFCKFCLFGGFVKHGDRFSDLFTLDGPFFPTSRVEQQSPITAGE